MEHLNTALAYFKEDGDDYYHLITSINAANLCIEQKLPEQALEYLTDAMPEAHKLGGDILGDALKCQALAYELLGDDGRECRKAEASTILEDAEEPEESCGPRQTKRK